MTDQTLTDRTFDRQTNNWHPLESVMTDRTFDRHDNWRTEGWQLTDSLHKDSLACQEPPKSDNLGEGEEIKSNRSLSRLSEATFGGSCQARLALCKLSVNCHPYVSQWSCRSNALPVITLSKGCRSFVCWSNVLSVEDWSVSYHFTKPPLKLFCTVIATIYVKAIFKRKKEKSCHCKYRFND